MMKVHKIHSGVNMAAYNATYIVVGHGARIVYTETIANPTTAVADLRNCPTSRTTPARCWSWTPPWPRRSSADPSSTADDLVLHSATKYIGGHSDVTGGVVTGRIGLISNIRNVRVDTGGSLHRRGYGVLSQTFG